MRVHQFQWGVPVRLLALAVVPLYGCISIAGNQLSDIEPHPGAVSPSIEQTVGDFSFHLDGGKMVTSNKMGRLLNDKILDRWVKTELIAEHQYVKSSEFSESSEYRLTLSGHQEGDSSIALQILSGLTLTVIPYTVNTQFDLQYTLEKSVTGCVFEANASDSIKHVVGLLLLPISPFTQGGARRTFERLSNSLYAQLEEQGAFEKHAPCVADQ